MAALTSGVWPASGADADAFHIAHWTTEQGLPQNRIHSLAQTPDGYLWIGTLDGLARFDGVSFTIYTVVNTREMWSDAINALTVDLDGTLWIGTADGLLAWRNSVVVRWTVRDGLADKNVYQVRTSPNGDIWWRANDGFGKLQNGRVTRYGTEHGLTTNKVWHIESATNGGLLAFTRDGLQRLDVERDRFGKLIAWPIVGLDWRGGEDSSARVWADCVNGSFQYEAGRWTSR